MNYPQSFNKGLLKSQDYEKDVIKTWFCNVLQSVMLKLRQLHKP